ncbi:PUR family DNA/RNA-binding protein [Phocaeicola sp.]|uniref:PUR family DNA/RNA-binding protein n=1 Tax=Phocaeicola sp. TaxID=2773926 RepID=UPI003AB1C3BA
MEDLKRNTATDVDKEIVFSKAIKAGKRIYYLDVKKNRKGEMFLAITESKKVVSGEGGNAPQVSFEKHKIFLYKEDFEKFMTGLQETIQYIESEQGPANIEHSAEEDGSHFADNTDSPLKADEIKIDIDF